MIRAAALATLLALPCAARPASAQAAPVPPVSTTFELPEARRVVLPNGLVLLLVEKHELPLTSMTLALRTGSLEDPETKPGVSAIAAELLRKGTATRTADQIADSIDALGMQYNAYSGVEMTAVSADFLARDTDRALALVADLVLHPVFPAPELAKTVAQRQERLRTDKDNVQLAVDNYMLATLYAGHPYSRALLTTEASLESIAQADIVSFHKRVYTPANAAIAVVGDFRAAEMEAKLRGLFGAWQGARPAEVKVPVLKPVTGRHVLLVDKPDATQTYFIVANTGIDYRSPDRAPLHVVNTLFGGRFTSLFNEELRVKSGYSYGASSRFNESATPGPFTMSTYTRNATTGPAIDKTFEVLDRLHTHPFTGTDLTSAKNYLRGTFPPTLETGPALAGTLAQNEVRGISRTDFNRELADEQTTDVARANAAIDRDYPARDNYVLVMVGKASEIAPLAAKYGTVTTKKLTDPGY